MNYEREYNNNWNEKNQPDEGYNKFVMYVQLKKRINALIKIYILSGIVMV
jgi:hypothetical protein